MVSTKENHPKKNGKTPEFIVIALIIQTPSLFIVKKPLKFQQFHLINR